MTSLTTIPFRPSADADYDYDERDDYDLDLSALNVTVQTATEPETAEARLARLENAKQRRLAAEAETKAIASRKRMIRYIEDAAFALLRYDISEGDNYADADAKCVAVAAIQNVSLTDAELAEMTRRLEHRCYFAD